MMNCNVKEKKLSIICVGDSITYGLCASSSEKSYPNVLGELLGQSYCVKGFGRNGASAITTVDFIENISSPYKKAPEYQVAISESPDIVIIMLGMNDANPTHRWNLPSGIMTEKVLADYKSGLCELIQDFQSLTSTPKVVLVQITPMIRTVEEGFEPDYVMNFTNNLVKLRICQEDIAREQGLFLIETTKYLNSPSYFFDGCHLTDIGYHKLAEIIRDGIFTNFPQLL